MEFGRGVVGCLLACCALSLVAIGLPIVAGVALGVGVGYGLWVALRRDEDESEYLDELDDEEAHLEPDPRRW